MLRELGELAQHEDQTLRLANDIDLHIDPMKPPAFYYYKRWLWVMFPWACIQTDKTFNFSAMIAKCYSSNIRYLSVTEDKLLTNRTPCSTDSVRIVRETKEKKRNITNMQNQTSQLSATHLEPGLHTAAEFHRPLHSSDSKSRDEHRLDVPNKRKLMPNPSIELNLLGLDEAPSEKTDQHSDLPQKKLLYSHAIPQSKKSLSGIQQPSSHAQLKTSKGFQPLKSTGPGTASLTARQAGTTEHSKFFGDLEDNAENLIRFRDSQIHTDRAPLSKDFKDGAERVERVLKQASRPGRGASQQQAVQQQSAKLLGQPKSSEPLQELRATLLEQNQRDMRALDKKRLELARELDEAKTRVRLKEKLFGQLGEQARRLEAEVEGLEQQKSGATASLLREKLHRVEESLRCEKLAEKRMARIIDICTLSKSQNEEWLRKLGFYALNLQKCIREQQVLVAETRRDGLKQERRLLDLEARAKTEKDRRDLAMLDAQETLDADRVIKKHLASTDGIIRESVLEKRREVQEKVEERIRNDDHQKKEEEVLRRNVEVQRELDQLKRDYSKYSRLLEKGAAGEAWDQKPEFVRLLANYQQSKSLEAELLQKSFVLKETQSKNALLLKKLKQLEQAKQLLVQLETDPEFLENQEKKLLQSIDTEKKRVPGPHQIAEATATLKALPKVTVDDHLIVAGIFARLNGGDPGGNPSDILQDPPRLRQVAAA